jgi:hypothetical protein
MKCLTKLGKCISTAFDSLLNHDLPLQPGKLSFGVFLMVFQNKVLSVDVVSLKPDPHLQLSLPPE